MESIGAVPTTRYLKYRSNWQRQVVFFYMFLTADQYILNKRLQLLSFKSW